MLRYLVSIIGITTFISVQAQSIKTVSETEVGKAWAGNSVNAVVFRKNALVTHGNTQFISFYDVAGRVVLGKRKTGEKNWQLTHTAFKGNIKDAHNSISMMVDGDGYLHLAWDHHNNPLNYSRSSQPFSIEMQGRMNMAGIAEKSVSYPEFYRMPDGDLLLLYRDGGSGRGNLVINKYHTKTKQWKQLHDNLVDGEGKRNAYWQATVDNQGVIHISWVWRETPDVASNHDMCYARSADGGLTWEKSSGEKYSLPITAATAEYAARIPQKSELINQTSMCTDSVGNPIIAAYWREPNSPVPQYHILYRQDNQWRVQSLGFRKTPFSLSGGGTKKIPISRPQAIAWNQEKKTSVAIVFRDEERDNRVSIAWKNNITGKHPWKLFDLTSYPVGSWEPCYDTELWKNKKLLSLFVQRVEQSDAEGMSALEPQIVRVLEWDPKIKKRIP